MGRALRFDDVDYHGPMNRKNVNPERAIDDLLSQADSVSAGEVASAASITRQAAHYNLRREVDAGRLEVVGRGRATRYRRPPGILLRYETAGLDEDDLWKHDVLRQLSEIAPLSEEAVRIERFAFTEMLN